mgnify:CR=1 FL=1
MIGSDWKKKSVFIAGDAAHLSPPFAGQGMNSGIRDVGNLGWKLALAIKKPRSKDILETYYLERKEPRPATVEYAEWQAKMSEVSNMAEIIVGKQRHGPTGNIFLEFEPMFTKFKDIQNN